MKQILSKHCTDERADRIAFILIKTGIGNVVYQYKKADKRIIEVTTEGVLIVKAPDGTIVTMHYASMEQARFFCTAERIPAVVVKAIKRNLKYNWIKEQNLVRY